MKTGPMKEVAQIIMGTAPPGISYNTRGDGIPMIAGAGDYGVDFPNPKKWTTAPTAIAEPGDLIICVRATIGDLNWADKRYCLGRGVAALRPKNGCVDPRFLAFFIQANKSALSRLGTGTTFLAIRRGNIENFEIPLPPLSEQKRIADILDKADAIRRKRREARIITQCMPLAMFRQAFQKYLNIERMEAVLSDVADVVSGVAKGRKLNGGDVREVPYLRVANVQAGYLDLSEIKTIPAKQSEIETLALKHGDIVMTEGGDYDKLGRGALWEYDISQCIHQNHVFRVRTDRKKILSTFFVHYLQTAIAKGYFLRCAKKTTNLASINMRQLRALPVPLPPISDQQRFEHQLRKIHDSLECHRKSDHEASNLFHSLIQQAFRDEL